MRPILFIAYLLPLTLCAQDADHLAKALRKGSVHAVDQWMEHELHRQRKGSKQQNGSTTYTVHGPTYDSLVAFLQQQPRVLDAAWDKCMMKEASWPGHSRIGLRFELNGIQHERCYLVQEGRPGNINLFGWRPQLRKARETLKFQGAEDCAGFIVEQRGLCEEQVH